MKRTLIVLGLLVVIVMAQWIITFYFFDRLPEKIPLNFPASDQSPQMGPKAHFFLFPGVSTLLMMVVFVFYFFRGMMSFPGKKLIAKLPLEFRVPVFDRAYQIVTMIVIFIIMLLAFLQLNLALYATGTAAQFNMFTFSGAIVVMIVYIVINLVMLKKMSAATADAYTESLQQQEKSE